MEKIEKEHLFKIGDVVQFVKENKLQTGVIISLGNGAMYWLVQFTINNNKIVKKEAVFISDESSLCFHYDEY